MEISRIAAGASATRFYSLNPASGTGKVESVDSIRQTASIGMLKKTLDFQADAAMKLLQSLPVVRDPALGQNVDVYA